MSPMSSWATMASMVSARRDEKPADEDELEDGLADMAVRREVREEETSAVREGEGEGERQSVCVCERVRERARARLSDRR